MHHREHPIVPSQQAATGALDLFVEGCQTANVRQQLIGLSVLQSSSAAQVHAAMSAVQASRRVSLAEIETMLAG